MVFVMSERDDKQQTDELFSDQLKDQFAFFYAVTLSAMELYRQARKQYHEANSPHNRDDSTT